MQVTNVKDYGALGDGSTNDLAAIKTALAAAVAPGAPRMLYFPPGEYIVGRDMSNSYSWDLTESDIAIVGVRGQSWLKHPAAMPNAAVAVLRIQSRSNVTLLDMGIDGNWGNPVTVVAPTSDDQALPQSTINVTNTAGFPSSGSFLLVINGANAQSISYTGKTATSFVGCSGGAGQLRRGQVIGYSDTQGGLNHTTQADPKNYGLMLRGVRNVLVQRCQFRQTYGDGIWVGATSSDQFDGSDGVRVLDCDVSVAARSGIALAGKCENITLRGCRFEHIYAQAFDTETVGLRVSARNVRVDDCYLDTWWNPASPGRTLNAPVSIIGGASRLGQAGLARNFRVTNCTIRGAVLIERAYDVRITDCRIQAEWGGMAYPLIYVTMFADNVVISGNQFYRRATGSSGATACVAVANYPSGSEDWQPHGVRVVGNRFRIVNGQVGIWLAGPGGRVGTGGTATGVTTATLTDSSKAWATNEWASHQVVMGGLTATIASNTATELTLASSGAAWFTPLGELATVPAAGAYSILARDSYIEVADNHIDGTDDGYGPGGKAVFIDNTDPGLRATISGNIVHNCTAGIEIKGYAAQTVTRLVLVDNHGYDDRPTPLLASLVNWVNAAPQYATLVMRGNSAGVGVSRLLADDGAAWAAGTWLVHEGDPTEWAGFGSPEGIVAATVGSTYRRVNGGAATAVYVKELGSGNTGWVAK